MTETELPTPEESSNNSKLNLDNVQGPEDVEKWLKDRPLKDAAGSIWQQVEQKRNFDKLSETDPLTDLPNRRGWDRQSKTLLANADRQNVPVTVMLIDLEKLNLVNNMFSHEDGDEYLQLATNAFKKSLREGDLAARVGGDEFYFLLPGAKSRQARRIKGRVIRTFRNSLEQLSLDHPLRKTEVGSSWGIHQLGGDETINDGLNKADKSMYGEKRARKAERKD